MRPAFVVVFLAMVAAQLASVFFVFFLSVALHELAHVFTAGLLGYRTKRIIITPMGQAAQISGLCGAKAVHRLLVAISGPAVSLIAALCLMPLGNKAHGIVLVNLLIFGWNMLPALPLDGGRVVSIFLARKLGVIPANTLCKKISRFTAVFIFGLGVVQTVLYPYTLSLVVVAFYLYKIAPDEAVSELFEYYKTLFSGSDEKYKRRLAVKTIYMPAGAAVKEALDLLSFDYMYMFVVIKDSTAITITEQTFLAYVGTNGISGSIGDIPFKHGHT